MKGFKTIIVNGALATAPIIDYVINNGELVSAIAGDHAGAVLSIIGLINIVLRWVTSTPVLAAE